MADQQQCPETSRLQILIEGSLAEDQQAELIAHLEHCVQCQAHFEELLGRSDFVPPDAKELLRRGDQPETALRQAIERLRAEWAGSQNDEQATVPLDDGVSPGEEEILLNLLEPGDEPDHLGRLGPYDIIEVTGLGGMGVVLKGYEERLNRCVAIKVLNPRLASNPMARKRFRRESRAAAAVAHEHVVTIHAVDEIHGLPILVMEFVEGTSLQRRIDTDGPLELEEILRVGTQTAQGLAAAHAQGLIHRDVKPSNILLENGVERVKLTDFGLARAVDDVQLTQSGVLAGTPEYMSPEQTRGETIDCRSDLFSLGCVLYAMCTGRSPFRAASAMAAMRRVSDDTPRPIREVNQDIPDWLVEIIDRLLAKDRQQRFESASDVAQLLGDHLAHLQHPAEVPQPARLEPLPDTGWRRGRRSSGRPWILGAVLVLSVLGAGLGVTEGTGMTHLVPTVIEIWSPRGTLVVEVFDPQVEVTVQGNGEEFTISGAHVHTFTLRAGKYDVIPSKDGQSYGPQTVKITRGGKPVVKVTRPPKPKIDYSGREAVSFTAPDLADGLSLVEPADGKFRIDQVDGKPVVRSTDKWYLYFDVADSYVHDLAPDAHIQVVIHLTVFDVGGAIKIHYDGFGDPYTQTAERQLPGSKKWVDLTFELAGSRLANRQNLGADFRIVSQDDARFPVSKVTVKYQTLTLPPAEPPPAKSAPPVEPVPTGEAVTVGETLELLPRVDLRRDRFQGEWNQQDDGFAGSSRRGALLRLPVLIEGSYELEIEYTRESGDEPVSVVLPVGRRLSALQLGSSLGVDGLQYADGKPFLSNATRTPSRTGVNGRRYRIVALVQVPDDEVTKQAASIDVSLDGEDYMHWSGDPRTLTVTNKTAAAGPGMPGFATYTPAVVLHRARLTLLSGNAYWLPDLMAVAPDVSFADAVLVLDFEKDRMKQLGKSLCVQGLGGTGSMGIGPGVAYTPDGKVGGALAVQAQGGYLRFPKGFVTHQSAYTLAAWVRPVVAEKPVYWYVQTGGGIVYHANLTPDPNPRLVAAAWLRGNWIDALEQPESLPLNRWSFVALTYREETPNFGKLRMTLNAQTYEERPFHRVVITDQVHAHIGAGQGTFAAIDELAIFYRVLSEEEIQQLYEMGQEGISLGSRTSVAAPDQQHSPPKEQTP